MLSFFNIQSFLTYKQKEMYMSRRIILFILSLSCCLLMTSCLSIYGVWAEEQRRYEEGLKLSELPISNEDTLRQD